MDKKASLNSSKREKDFALWVGVMVAGAHFVFTVIMIPLSENYDSIMQYFVELIIIALIAPSSTPILMVADALSIDSPPLDSFSPFLVLLIAYLRLFLRQRVLNTKDRPTQRAPDWWESARFQTACVAWGWFR